MPCAAANPAIALRLQSTRPVGRVAELGSLGIIKRVIALKQALQDWKDFDEAQRHLAVCLGLSIVDSDGPKGLFWSRNPMSLMLCTILAQMVQVGVLEQNHEDQYRWNPAFPAELEEYYQEWGKNLKRGSNDA